MRHAPRVGRTSLGPDFGRFLLAAASSNLGDGIRLGALPLLALSLTDDALLISLVSAANLVPWLVFGPLGGAIVDRSNRRTLMIGAQLARGLLVAVLTVLVVTESVTIWWLVVIALALGVGEILVDSSSQAAVPQLVAEADLDRANGRMIAAITVLDQVVGVALGAALFSVAAGLPFAVDAVTFAVGGLLLLTIRRPLQGERSGVPTRVRSDIADGARFLFRHRLLRGVMAAVAISNLAGNVSFAVVVVLVVDELGTSEAAFGLVLGVGAVGGVLGSFVASSLAERFGRRRVLGVLPAVLAVTFLVNAAATAAWMVALSFFVSSFAIVCFNVPGQSLRQSVTPEPLLGRVVATFRTVGMGAAPIGAVLGGLITEAFGVRMANVAAAGIEAVGWVLLVAALRHLDDAMADRPNARPPETGPSGRPGSESATGP